MDKGKKFAIRIDEIAFLDLLEIHPTVFGMLRQSELAACLEETNPGSEGAFATTMDETCLADSLDGLQDAAELLLEFAHQGLLVALSSLKFSTGEFPEPAKLTAHHPAGKEHLLAPDDN